MRRLARRLHALAVTVTRAHALADTREELVAVTLERDRLADRCRLLRGYASRQWGIAVTEAIHAVTERARADDAERALADFETMIMGDRP